MAIILRKSAERGYFNHGWLKTFHTFSFGDYDDPRYRGFRSLRVINEDRVEANRGFPPHSHRDMEILTLILEGELAHRDSTGTASTIHAGEAQMMSAGTGIMHSEANPSATQEVHFLQIWLYPESRNLSPGYQQKPIPKQENRWTIIASKDAKEGSLKIHQDATVAYASLAPENALEWNISPERGLWIHLIKGKISLNDLSLQTGDGAAIEKEKAVRLSAEAPSQVLLFDLGS